MLSLIVVSVMATADQICLDTYYGGDIVPPQAFKSASYECNKTAEEGYCTKFLSHYRGAENIVYTCIDERKKYCHHWTSQICLSAEDNVACEFHDYYMKCTNTKYGLCASWIEYTDKESENEYRCFEYNQFGCSTWVGESGGIYFVERYGINPYNVPRPGEISSYVNSFIDFVGKERLGFLGVWAVMILILSCVWDCIKCCTNCFNSNSANICS